MSDFPQADKTMGLPHPNKTEQIFGHDAPSAQVLEAINGDRVPIWRECGWQQDDLEKLQGW